MNGMRVGAVGWLLASLCLVGLVGCPGELAPICEAEPSIQCGACGAQGFVCAGGDKPSLDGGPYQCSVQGTAGGASTYCCYLRALLPTSCTGPTFTASVTAADDGGMQITTQGCWQYQCSIGDNPAAVSPGLECDEPVRDPDGMHDEFCCWGSPACGG
jgi:hypothetical protein